MKPFDVVALGELLIDFTENGASAQGNTLFEACPGGAPCNMLAMLRKLGKECAFIGKVGNDMFGRLLRQVILDAGIQADTLILDDEIPTTLAFVKTLPDGDREFSFYRKPGADMMLTEEELPLERIRNARIFHFGTLSMTDEPVRSANFAAAKHAKAQGAFISFDCNYRATLWESEEEAKAAIAAIVAETGAASVKDMGAVMALVKVRLAGQFDMGKASGLVKAALS